LKQDQNRKAEDLSTKKALQKAALAPLGITNKPELPGK
jgi:hypothetical protein